MECKKRGSAAIGIEANPVAYLALKVKTDWSLHPHGLRGHVRRIADAAEEALRRDGIRDTPFFNSLRMSPDLALRSPPEAERLLLSNSISPLPLHKLLTLRNAIKAQRQSRMRDHERVALATTAVNFASNLHFGPEVGVRGRKADAVVADVTRKGLRLEV